MLTEHKEGHNKLAQLLIEREVIFAEDVENIFGKRQWVSRSQEIMNEQESTVGGTEEHEGEVSADSVEETREKE